MEKGLVNFFEDYLTKKPIFRDKLPLQSNFMPDQILYREEQVRLTAQILAPSLRLEKCSNIFIYGKTGTGKTLVAKHVLQQLNLVSEQKKIPLKLIYVNCKLRRVADTEYRLIAQLSREFQKKDRLQQRSYSCFWD